MLKPFMFFFILFHFLISGSVYALNIVNFDAFTQGDKYAMLDIDTGLVWMDFGVNNGKSINTVIKELDEQYSDWRLPTELEVISLWRKLIDKNETQTLLDVFDIWGANKTPLDNLPYLSWGYFLDDEGYLGVGAIIEESRDNSIRYLGRGYYSDNYAKASLLKKVVDRKYDGSNYYPFVAEGILEISTLLVRKSAVSESSVLSLLFVCFFTFLVSLRLKPASIIFNKLKLFISIRYCSKNLIDSQSSINRNFN